MRCRWGEASTEPTAIIGDSHAGANLTLLGCSGDPLERILADRDALYGRGDAAIDTSGRTVEAYLKELVRLTEVAAWAREGRRIGWATV